MIIILLGPPGVGKGTQAEVIAEKFSVPHISTGGIFRGKLKDGTPLSLEIKKYMEAGALVPDELTVRLVTERLAAPDARKGALLDGFPRDAAQAEALDAILAGTSRRVNICLSLKAPDDILAARLSGRRVCRRCGAGYHVVFSPPPADGACLRCGGEIHQRDDDREETIKNRLAVYHHETSPLIQWYGERGLLKTIDVEGPVGEISNRIFAALKDLG